MVNSEAESQVRDFYEEGGWDVDAAGVYRDADLFEDLRSCAAEYVSASRRKLLTHLPKTGDLLLDAASGPIQFPEYLQYSLGFSKHVCVDVSQRALDEAAKKLGSRGEYVKASVLDLPFPDDHFDAGVSIHTIFHVDEHQQEAAVRELVRCTKPAHPLIIIYHNPHNLFRLLNVPVALLRKKFFHHRNTNTSGSKAPPYFHSHSLRWWRRFSDQCTVRMLPWRFLQPRVASLLIPDNGVGEAVFRGVMLFEERFPRLATLLGAHPMIILEKRER